MSMSTSRPPTSVENPQTDLLNALSAYVVLEITNTTMGQIANILFGRLYVGGKYSDLTICCNYRQWAVHRAVVCSRSAFFDGACGNQFREANSGIIDLSEDDEEAVEQMVHCMLLKHPNRLFYNDQANNVQSLLPSRLPQRDSANVDRRLPAPPAIRLTTTLAEET